MKIDRTLANKFAAIGCNRIDKWSDEELRDWIDYKTGGELDCVELDILTEMVRRAYNQWAAQ